MRVLAIQLRCVPPSVTAQQKRLRIVSGRPVFFHGERMRKEETTWAALLAEHQPAAPFEGPVSLTVKLTYPHLRATAKKSRHLTIPKVSKPDAGNAGKHLEDVLVRLRFIGDDQQVARLIVEKWHGPEEHVGIGIVIAPMGAEES